MNYLIVGNALCLIGSIIMLLMGLIREKRRFLWAQSVMNAFFIAGNLALGGIAGAITNAATMLRNFYSFRWNIGKWEKGFFIALQLVLGVVFRLDSVILWLPVIGTCVFTWYMDTENMVLLKFICIATQICWATYDFSILNYATVPFDIGSAITNAIGIAGILRGEKKEKANNGG